VATRVGEFGGTAPAEPARAVSVPQRLALANGPIVYRMSKRVACMVVASLSLRFDLRMPGLDGPARARQYAACLDICEWADSRGFDGVGLSEHHCSPDGYLPAPLALAGAIFGRTRSMRVLVSALLVPLNDPIRLAETIAVLDLASRGRLMIVAGQGYRPEEFEAASVERRRAGKLLESSVRAMLDAWTGEPFEYLGRRVHVTPAPLSQPHPWLAIGGSTAKGARRAARLRLPFAPSSAAPGLADAYRTACEQIGYGGRLIPMTPSVTFVHVSEDPERDWPRVAPHALHDAGVYAGWRTPGQRVDLVDAPATTDPDRLRATGDYRVVTPDECVALVHEGGSRGALVLHPLMGGLPPDLAWESLELFDAKVRPRLGGSAFFGAP